MEHKHDNNTGTGLGCLFAVLLAVVSVFIPFVVIWILTLSGIGLKYSVITYFGAGFSIFIIILMTFDVKSKSVNVNNVNIKDNENSDKSNQRQD
jgi:hypothetical protein